MKTPEATPLFSLGLLTSVILAGLLSAGNLRADEGVTDAETIRSQVVEPALTRSIRGPATEIRKGYTLGTSRSAGKSRSLAMTEIKVNSEARMTFSNIRFKLNSTEPADSASIAQLAQLAESLRDLPEGAAFLIEGHTCSLGSNEVNDKLSAERADSVRDYLIKSGVPASALQAIGCGAAEAHKEGVMDDAGEASLAPYRKVMFHKIVQ